MSELYAGLKLLAFRPWAIRVTHIWFGLPGLALSRGHFLGIPCEYGVVPLYPFINCSRHNRGGRFTAHGVWQRSFDSLLVVSLSLASLVAFIWILASLAYLTWGYPQRPTVITLSNIKSPLTLDGSQLQAGDIVVMVGKKRIVDMSTLTSKQSPATMALLMRDGRFLPPIRLSSITNAVSSGQLSVVSQPVPTALRVRHVLPDSPAYSHGVQRDDIIAIANGRNVRSIEEFVDVVDRHDSPKLQVQLRRAGILLPAIDMPRDTNHNLGIIVDPYVNVWPRPVTVSSISPAGRAARAGLSPGDILVEVNDIPINGIADFAESTSSLSKHIDITVWRAEHLLRYRLEPTLTDTPGSNVGVVAEDVPLERLGIMQALSLGRKFARYSLSIPFQLPVQLCRGLTDPHGVYGVWSSFLSWGIPPLDLGIVASTRTWLGGWKYLFIHIPAFLLSAAVPFMITLEYLCCSRILIAGVSGRWLRLAAAGVFFCLFCLLGFLLSSRHGGLIVYEFQAFDEQILTVRSLWRF